MLKKYGYLIIILTVILACNDSRPINIDNIDNIEVDIKQEKSKVQYNEYFSSSKLVALETNSQSVFSKIDRISLFNDKIFILDKNSNAVLVFSEVNGKFLFKINNIGKGPQEYQRLSDFAIDEDNNNIVLFSELPRAIFKYNLNGDFIKKIKINRNRYFNIAHINNDQFLFLNKSIKDKHLLFKYNIGNKEKQGSIKINERDKIYEKHVLASSPSLTKDENIHLTLPYSEIIYEYNDENELSAKYYIDFGENKMPENAYEKNRKFSELFSYGTDNDYGYGICHFRENKNYITFKTQVTQTVIYSKKTKTSQLIKNIINNHLIDGAYIAHNGKDNKFLTVCSSMDFINRINIYKKKSTIWDVIPDNIKKLSQEITELSNPLLIIYTFKE